MKKIKINDCICTIFCLSDDSNVIGKGPFPCQEIVHLNGVSGEIKMPLYPEYEYPSDAKCEWIIQVPDGQV